MHRRGVVARHPDETTEVGLERPLGKRRRAGPQVSAPAQRRTTTVARTGQQDHLSWAPRACTVISCRRLALAGVPRRAGHYGLQQDQRKRAAAEQQPDG
jgi:hypothetical protein